MVVQCKPLPTPSPSEIIATALYKSSSPTILNARNLKITDTFEICLNEFRSAYRNKFLLLSFIVLGEFWMWEQQLSYMLPCTPLPGDLPGGENCWTLLKKQTWLCLAARIELRPATFFLKPQARPSCIELDWYDQSR